MSRTVRDLADAGILPRHLIDRAAVERSLGLVAMTISLCAAGGLREVARTNVGLAARIIRRGIEARRLARELADIHPSSPDALSLHRRASILAAEMQEDLTRHCDLQAEMRSPLVIEAIRAVGNEAGSQSASILTENGIECVMFSMRQYHEAIGVRTDG